MLKLAWTDTFRHLISSLHSWGRTAPTPCVSNLNLIGDHLQPLQTEEERKSIRLCLRRYTSHCTMLWRSTHLRRVTRVNNLLSTRCSLFHLFVVKLKTSACTNECINTNLVIWTFCQVEYVFICPWQFAGSHQGSTHRGGGYSFCFIWILVMLSYEIKNVLVYDCG